MDALQFFFDRDLSGPRPLHASLGCMLVNTVVEMAGVDDVLSDRASQLRMQLLRQVIRAYPSLYPFEDVGHCVPEWGESVARAALARFGLNA